MPADRSPEIKPATTDQWRTFFAAERTLLAWVRTALAMMGFGFLVERFGLFLRQLAAVRGEPSPPGTRASVWFGVALVLLGTAVLAGAGRRHLRSLRHFAAGTELAKPSASGTPLAVAGLLMLFGLALAAYLLRLG